MASANIFSQYLQPVRSVADYRADMDAADLRASQLQGAQRKNAMEEMAFGQAQRKQNALQQIAAGWGPQTSMEDRINSLRGNPLTFGEADALEKSHLERQKTGAEVDSKRQDVKSKQLGDAQKRLEVAGQAFGFVKDNPSVESAQAAIQGLLQAGVYDENGAQAAWAKVQANPTPEGIRALATQAYQQALSAKDQLPQYFNQNRGGTFGVAAVNPVTGASRDVQSAPITQSADNAASNARAATEGAANRAVQVRGQNMTDARARDANENGKSLVNQERQLKIDALQEKKDAATRGKAASAATVDSQIAVIDKALNHPGRATATGLSGSADPRNYIPGTDATDFRVVLDQIGGAAFLQAFESLKGGGAITEVEGKKATDAIARLNRAQSDSEFETSLRDLRAVMATGKARLAGGSASSPAPAGKTVNFGDLK